MQKSQIGRFICNLCFLFTIIHVMHKHFWPFSGAGVARKACRRDAEHAPGSAGGVH